MNTRSTTALGHISGQKDMQDSHKDESFQPQPREARLQHGTFKPEMHATNPMYDQHPTTRPSTGLPRPRPPMTLQRSGPSTPYHQPQRHTRRSLWSLCGLMMQLTTQAFDSTVDLMETNLEALGESLDGGLLHAWPSHGPQEDATLMSWLCWPSQLCHAPQSPESLDWPRQEEPLLLHDSRDHHHHHPSSHKIDQSSSFVGQSPPGSSSSRLVLNDSMEGPSSMLPFSLVHQDYVEDDVDDLEDDDDVLKGRTLAAAPIGPVRVGVEAVLDNVPQPFLDGPQSPALEIDDSHELTTVLQFILGDSYAGQGVMEAPSTDSS